MDCATAARDRYSRLAWLNQRPSENLRACVTWNPGSAGIPPASFCLRASRRQDAGAPSGLWSFLGFMPLTSARLPSIEFVSIRTTILKDVVFLRTFAVWLRFCRSFLISEPLRPWRPLRADQVFAFRVFRVFRVFRGHLQEAPLRFCWALFAFDSRPAGWQGDGSLAGQNRPWRGFNREFRNLTTEYIWQN